MGFVRTSTPPPFIPPLALAIQNILLGEIKTRLSRAPKLAHYTSLRGCKAIIESKEAHFSLAADTDDRDEVKRAADIIRTALEHSGPNIFKKVPFARLGALEHFDRWYGELVHNTYIFAFTDHDNTPDADRIDMWAMYGERGRGACAVFKTAALLGQNVPRFAVQWSPITYATDAELEDRLAALLRQIENLFQSCPYELKRLLSVGHLGELVAFAALTLVLGHKGRKWEFQHELRFVHTRAVSSYVPNGAGVRQVYSGGLLKQKFVLPLKNYPEFGVNADLGYLLDHILIGPCGNQRESAQHIREVLDRNGLEHIPVELSQLPYQDKAA